MSRSRLVPLALAVTLLLAVVAFAARGRPLGSNGGHGGGLPLSFWDYVYTTGVILIVPAVLVGMIAISYIRRKHGKRQSFWRSNLRTLIAVAIIFGLELLFVRRLHLSHLRLHPHHPQEAGVGPGRVGQNGAHSRLARSRAPRFRYDELAFVLGLLFLVVVGAIIALRRSRPQLAPEVAPEALAAALDVSLDDLRSDPDLRRAIIAAYARMEHALAAAGVPRQPSEAPLEYLERALLALDTSAEAVRRLTDLFEWARFSHHEPEPWMRDDAVDALVAVRDELRASELVPA